MIFFWLFGIIGFILTAFGLLSLNPVALIGAIVCFVFAIVCMMRVDTSGERRDV